MKILTGALCLFISIRAFATDINSLVKYELLEFEKMERSYELDNPLADKDVLESMGVSTKTLQKEAPAAKEPISNQKTNSNKVNMMDMILLEQDEVLIFDGRIY